MKTILIFLFAVSAFSCNSSDDDATGAPDDVSLYFPPLTGSEWETQSMTDLGWNPEELDPLLEFLEASHSRSLIILVDGKIVVEEYFNAHSATTPWYWASAGKTLTSAVSGIAEYQGILNLDAPVSDYLGTQWTSLTPAQELAITSRHLLEMTSGLEDQTYGDCVSPECLTFVADAGTRWAYHNVYVKLQDVVAEASGLSWDAYFNNELKNRIGMSGAWQGNGDLSVYWSTTRSMARFGLLTLNKGKWENEQIIPENYMTQATTRSQEINKSYGYLWWINGEPNYHLPQTQFQFNGSLIPDAPEDMYMALGKNDQKIYVVPSKRMVVIRMGESAEGTNFALSDFDQNLWDYLNALIN